MTPIPWSENLSFPEICQYCTDGCYCGSPIGLTIDDMEYPGEQAPSCNYCQEICECDAGDVDSSECECNCQCCDCSCDCQPLLVDAESYNLWIKKNCYVCDSDCFTYAKPTVKQCLQKLGKYEFYVRVYPTHITETVGFLWNLKPQTIRASLDIIQEDKQSKVSFSDFVYIPILSVKSTDSRDIVWMSLTPSEVFSQREALPLAKGHVLIAGLGLGWLTSKVLENPLVDLVTQIEIDSEIAKFFGNPLQVKYPNKFQLITANVWNFLNDIDLEQFDTILFDIWPRYGMAYSDKKFQLLKQQHSNVWGWGDYYL